MANRGEKCTRQRMNYPQHRQCLALSKPHALVLLRNRACFSGPKNNGYSQGRLGAVFFVSINSLSKGAKWTPLRQVDIPRGSLEMRVWIGFGVPRYFEWLVC
jgi:hypothetical protein